MPSTYMPTQYNSRIHPKKFALFLGLGSIIMTFAGLTSAVIVRRSGGDWVLFKIPEIFIYSTIAVILSSIVFQVSFWALKKENYNFYRIGLVFTFLLGLVFTYFQFAGWEELSNYGVRLRGNPSGSFLYLISGLHLAHLLAGLIILFILLIRSFFTYGKDIVKNLVNESKTERFLGAEMALIYWHFVGVLWIYLYFFFNNILV